MSKPEEKSPTTSPSCAVPGPVVWSGMTGKRIERFGSNGLVMAERSVIVAWFAKMESVTRSWRRHRMASVAVSG